MGDSRFRARNFPGPFLIKESLSPQLSLIARTRRRRWLIEISLALRDESALLWRLQGDARAYRETRQKIPSNNKWKQSITFDNKIEFRVKWRGPLLAQWPSTCQS